jgi:hypothetical protein
MAYAARAMHGLIIHCLGRGSAKMLRDWDKARLILNRLVGGTDLEPWGTS